LNGPGASAAKIASTCSGLNDRAPARRRRPLQHAQRVGVEVADVGRPAGHEPRHGDRRAARALRPLGVAVDPRQDVERPEPGRGHAPVPRHEFGDPLEVPGEGRPLQRAGLDPRLGVRHEQVDQVLDGQGPGRGLGGDARLESVERTQGLLAGRVLRPLGQ
jgi:hypothetical protein